MAKWMRTLDIVNVWTQAYNHAYNQTESIDDVECAKITLAIGKALSELADYGIPMIDQDKKTLINLFNNFSGDEDEFNELMNDLYDWADISLGNGKKTCRIKTF